MRGGWGLKMVRSRSPKRIGSGIVKSSTRNTLTVTRPGLRGSASHGETTEAPWAPWMECAMAAQKCH